MESSDDDDNDGDHKLPSNGTADAASCVHPPQHGLPPSSLAIETAMDVDAGREIPPMIGGNLSHWPPSVYGNGCVQPSPIPHNLVNQSLNINGGRTPITNATTPTYGYPLENGPPADLVGSDTMVSTDEMISKNASLGKNHETAWWCRQRLPSPISEDGNAPVSSDKASPTDAEMAYNSSRPASPPLFHHHEQRNDCPKDQPLTGPWMETEPSSMSIEQTKQPANNSPGKKKITFSMGYRADCDKCRRKVPGHYSHIIRA